MYFLAVVIVSLVKYLDFDQQKEVRKLVEEERREVQEVKKDRETVLDG